MKMPGCIIGMLLIFGCESQSSKMHERQDQALRDPMNYSSHAGDRTDISGGGTLDFKKDAFKKDLDSVINP